MRSARPSLLSPRLVEKYNRTERKNSMTESLFSASSSRLDLLAPLSPRQSYASLLTEQIQPSKPKDSPELQRQQQEVNRLRAELDQLDSRERLLTERPSHARVVSPTSVASSGAQGPFDGQRQADSITPEFEPAGEWRTGPVDDEFILNEGIRMIYNGDTLVFWADMDRHVLLWGTPPDPEGGVPLEVITDISIDWSELTVRIDMKRGGLVAVGSSKRAIRRWVEALERQVGLYGD
ncbi:hypothetical protein J8273_7879 [Carpediemonas membranifera]|uniref:Uncharacterized protein n=1 Tax=Carpediemonas membranifera TaxID=201153 RepID=A0A8J6AX49_9EUKA|nr:hypothetical protein J8273_7879 [Carpediemonas membranifera]|eukprot:KAG9390528.1 hypothetical protein J8273_7879 [Carpediemonas membranifera]